MSKSRNQDPNEQPDETPRETQAGTEHAAEETRPTAEGDDPLTALQIERDQLHNQLQRTLADLQNFRKRRVQEMADSRRSALEGLVSELLPVLDNFHLATDFDTAGEGTEFDGLRSMREGLLMVRSLLEGVFERHGVTEILALGEAFDPARHEAVGFDPDPEAPEGQVTQVLQRGYLLDGRILRPTRVIVGGAPATNSEDQE